MTASYRKKLIEVALPLEAINREAAREKSIRHGHPSTLHLWWARRPLAACRAVLFASLVDDPSAHPDKFPSEEAQEAERQRLFRIIEELVKWENSNNERVLTAARQEILRSCDGKPPPVYDPFCGGGSIPLEAQRLGLEAHASDLNPVPVLITKALIEIPPLFAGKPPVNPESRKKLAASGSWKGAAGLAEDIRYYGQWMRDEAEKRIGHLYPKVKLPKEHGGGEATVIAWLWARTVASPNPAAKGAHVPLIKSFWLSKTKGRKDKTWLEPLIDEATMTYRFLVKIGQPSDEATIKEGTKTARGANFRCLLTGATISGDHIKSEGKAGRLSSRLIGIVAEGSKGRVYVAPDDESEQIAASAKPNWLPEEELANDPRNIWCISYGLTHFKHLFTSRQLVAATTFSELIGEARADALKASGGNEAYATGVATYLGFALSKVVDLGTTLVTWRTDRESSYHTFGKQALPMSWDYCELNPLLEGTGTIVGAATWTAKSVAESFSGGTVVGTVTQNDATVSLACSKNLVISTDPPYYDNIAYADLSDFFLHLVEAVPRPFLSSIVSHHAHPKGNRTYCFTIPARRGEREGQGVF